MSAHSPIITSAKLPPFVSDTITSLRHASVLASGFQAINFVNIPAPAGIVEPSNAKPITIPVVAPTETVLDNCMGSGSTGVACVNTNRNFIGIELDKEYFKIAKDRISNIQ